MTDLIHNPAAAPSFEEITGYIQPPTRALWSELNGFIQGAFQAKPKIAYSVCAGKPGWNVKYQKSGKAICTLYPETDCLIALVVVKEELAALLPGAQPPLHPAILHLVQTVKPFNHTLWLMISVTDGAVLESVKDLLVQKQAF